MTTSSRVRPIGLPAPRTCTCCGESFPTRAFTYNARLHQPTPTCRSCGVWLTLMRQVFPQARDVLANRAGVRDRKFDQRARARTAGGAELQNIWRLT